MGSEELAQRLGDGAGAQEVGDRQAEGHLPVPPASGIVGPAGGAMAVAAGMIGIVRLLALGAVPELTAGLRRTATGQVAQDAAVSRRHAFREPLHIREAMAADDVRQSAHYSWRMSWWSWWAAALCPCSVMWV